MNLSVVAPCYNEEAGLSDFYFRMRDAVRAAGISDYEIILVDDGSRDRTWNIITEIHSKDQKVRGIKLSRNFGHQAALAAGLHEAKGRMILIIDSDLQDPPELLRPMIEKMNEGFDVVYGERRVRHGETAFKKGTAKAFYRFLGVTSDIKIPQDTGDFRLINRPVLEAYNSLKERARFTRGLIAWLGFRQTPLSYDRSPRHAGETHYSLKKMIGLAADAIIGFSLKPIRVIMVLGVVMMPIALLAIPWSGLAALMIFLSGVQLLAIGLVGEYVGRSYLEVRQRPLYVIQEGTYTSEKAMFAAVTADLEASPSLQGQ